MISNQQAGDFACAVRLYSGPFLDGFQVTGASDLEEWIAGQRVRLEDRAIAALDALAAEAQSVLEESPGPSTIENKSPRCGPFDTNAPFPRYIVLLARLGKPGRSSSPGGSSRHAACA